MASSRALIDYPSEIQRLREENERLQSHLEDAAFMSVRKNKMTDAIIMQKFENICDDMEQWINAVLADAQPGKIIKQHRQIQRTKTSALDSLYQHGLLPPELADAENLEHLHLTLMITEFLMEEVFLRDYPVGLRKSQQKDLFNVEQIMDRLGNDQLTISTWRLDTVDALVSQPPFEGEQQDAVLKLLRRADKVLAPWLPAAHMFAKHEPQFKRDLLESAVRLDQAMKTSPDKYLIHKPKFKPLPTPFPNEAHGSFQLIDLETWQKISQHGVETILCVLFPGVVRVTAESANIPLVKPTLVVSHSLKMPGSPQRSGTEDLPAMYPKSMMRREHATRRRHSDSESHQSAEGRQKEPRAGMAYNFGWTTSGKAAFAYKRSTIWR